MSGDPSPAELTVEPSSTTCGPAHQVLRHPGILSRMSPIATARARSLRCWRWSTSCRSAPMLCGECATVTG
jgi:hypothetical protein